MNELIKANEQFLHVNKLYKDVLEGKYVAAKEDAKTDVKQSTQAAQPTQPSQPTQKTTDLLGMASLNLGKGDLNDGINSQASPAPNREKSPDLLDQVFGNAPVVQKQTSAFDDDAFMALAKKRG